MLNKFNNNVKSIIKQIPNIQNIVNAKSALYIGLVAYWGVIIFSTFFKL